MVSELKTYQSSVGAFQCEIERINGQIKDLKGAYFQLKKQNLSAIREMPEEQYQDQGPHMGQGMEQDEFG